MRWSIFLCGAGLLCLASWIDNIRGPLLPTIASLMSLNNSSAALMVSFGNLVSMATTWLLMPMLNKWSLRQVSISVLLYSILACSAASLVNDATRLFIWGALIGGCISTMGSLSNLFVQNSTTSENRGQVMSGLHSLYGLSSLFAPWMAGIILVRPENWQNLFTSIAPACFVVALLIYFQGPGALNSPIQKECVEAQQKPQPIAISFIHIYSISVLILYVLAEVLVSTWLASFLVNEYKMDIQSSSIYTSGFFAAMLITRLACLFGAKPKWHRLIIWICLLTSFICFVTGRLAEWLWLLPLTGVIGPFFPLYMTRLSLRFPERDRSMVIWMLSGMQAALSIMNYVMGYFADLVGFGIAFWLPALMLILTAFMLLFAEWRLKKHAE